MADGRLGRAWSVRAAVPLGLMVLALLLLLVPPAQADQAGVTVSVDRTQVVSGRVLTVTAAVTSTRTRTCDWVIGWTGPNQVIRDQQRVTTRWVAPVVERPTRLRVTALCLYQAPRPPVSGPRPIAPTAERIIVTVPPRLRGTTTVTVVPPGFVAPPQVEGPKAPGTSGPPVTPGGVGLPATGGPQRWVLIAGLAALIGGAVVVRRRRPAGPR